MSREFTCDVVTCLSNAIRNIAVAITIFTLAFDRICWNQVYILSPLLPTPRIIRMPLRTLSWWSEGCRKNCGYPAYISGPCLGVHPLGLAYIPLITVHKALAVEWIVHDQVLMQRTKMLTCSASSILIPLHRRPTYRAVNSFVSSGWTAQRSNS
jgi:hypothetical protein